MIKRTLYFGSQAYLHCRKEQLIVELPRIKNNDDKSPVSRINNKTKIPIEDIGTVILDSERITLSNTLLFKLLQNNTALISCNEKHLPQGMMLNLDANNTQQETFRYQTNAGKALKNRLWKQTVEQKIKNQAYLLQAVGQNHKELLQTASKVKSGDPENAEGKAAAHYWKFIFKGMFPKFRRNREGKHPNALLNYAYTLIRATLARSAAASGLMPTLGIHHRNKYNAYALADDLMEPYRVFADYQVRDLAEKYYHSEHLGDNWLTNKEIKKELLYLPHSDVLINDKIRPLMIAARETAASLKDCLTGKKKKIIYPEFNPDLFDV